MNETTTKTRPKVAVATGATRAGAVGNALRFVRGEILAAVRGRVMVKPNFLSSTCQRASTHPDAVRPVLALLRDAGIGTVELAEGGSRSTPVAIGNFGYQPMLDDFAVPWRDLNRTGFGRTFDILTADRKVHLAGYSDALEEYDTIISIPVAKTHDSAMVTLSVKNMMGCIRRVHRPRLHGIPVGDGASACAERLWNTLEGHPVAFKSFSGAVFYLMHRIRALDRFISRRESPGLLRQMAAMAENLCRMAVVMMPDVAVIDAFEAMEGNGPGCAGTSVDMRVAVAGTDAVACDAVAARLMGFDPMTVGYLALCHERGLGCADPAGIDIVGEDIQQIGRSFTPHTNYPLQLKWREAWT